MICTETTRQRNAAAQKRRRKRAREYKRIFGLAINDHLVPLAFLAMGHGDNDLTDHTILEALLAPWVEQQLESVISDSKDEDLRVQFADMKRELLKVGVA